MWGLVLGVRDGELPDGFKGRQAEVEDMLVGVELAFDNFTGAIEDGKYDGGGVKQPEVIAGQRNGGSETPWQPPYFFTGLNQHVSTSPLEADVVADGFGDDTGAADVFAGLDQVLYAGCPGASLRGFGNVVTGAAGVDGDGGALFNQGANATMTVSHSALVGNKAIGGAGAAGADGGDGVGGGIFDDGTLILTDSALAYNLALGGKGGEGGDGGDGLGGGLAVQPGAQATASGSTITHNRADGGARGHGGSDGQGLGGGVYDLGAFVRDALTAIEKNKASTSGDDFYP